PLLSLGLFTSTSEAFPGVVCSVAVLSSVAGSLLFSDDWSLPPPQEYKAMPRSNIPLIRIFFIFFIFGFTILFLFLLHRICLLQSVSYGHFRIRKKTISLPDIFCQLLNGITGEQIH